MYELMGINVEWKYLNGKCVEMIGLIGNMLMEIIGIVWKYIGNIWLEKGNNLELGRDYEVDII